MKLISLLLLLAMASCGNQPDGTERADVLREKITCDNYNVCKGERITCTKENYYSEDWNCVVFVKEKDYLE